MKRMIDGGRAPLNNSHSNHLNNSHGPGKLKVSMDVQSDIAT